MGGGGVETAADSSRSTTGKTWPSLSLSVGRVFEIGPVAHQD